MKPEKNVKKAKLTRKEKVPKKKGNSKLIIGVVAVVVIIAAIYLITSSQKPIIIQINQVAVQGSQSNDPQELKLLLNKIEDLAKQGKQSGSSQEIPILNTVEQLAAQNKQSDNIQQLKTILNQVQQITGEIKLPSYAYTNPLTLKAYKYATEHPEALEQIPCYCGCGGHSGHRFLRDCFIHDDWTYDEHASFCDVCIGEAIKVQDYLASGKTLKEARALIDAEYSPKGDRTNTPPVRDDYTQILSPKLSALPSQTPAVEDLSKYALPDNFKSIADGLKFTPAVVSRAYFANVKMLTGTEMEAQYIGGSVQPDAFYGKKVIGMYSADYSPTSWIEIHDLGYDHTKGFSVKGRNEAGMKNIVNTRPLIYGHSQNVDNVLRLMNDPASMDTSYSFYKPLLDAVDYENAAFALVLGQPEKFSDMNYMSMTPINGRIELVKAYNITDNVAIPSGFSRYDPQMKGNILIIKVTGDLSAVQTANDNIDAVART